jgi:hypothetical protein
MKLHNDISRCVDEKCLFKEKCARWTQIFRLRDTGDKWLSFCATMYEEGDSRKKECDYFIKD